MVAVRPVPANAAPSSPQAYYSEPSSDCKRPGTRFTSAVNFKCAWSCGRVFYLVVLTNFSLGKTNIRLRLREHLRSAFTAIISNAVNNTARGGTRPPHAISTATRNAKRASISQGRCLFQTLLFLFLLVIPPFLTSCSLANGQPILRDGPYIQRA